MLEEEQEALEAIYAADFEVLSCSSWLIHVGCGTALRVELPVGYPASRPPCVWVECPHGTAPPDIQASLEACDNVVETGTDSAVVGHAGKAGEAGRVDPHIGIHTVSKAADPDVARGMATVSIAMPTQLVDTGVCERCPAARSQNHGGYAQRGVHLQPGVFGTQIPRYGRLAVLKKRGDKDIVVIVPRTD
ncbi:hypothetical protein AK812_SmicGene21601 [Symbiodinium microadriaticum]|uniref:RWD domain-containing protein n=1 Tax=Symbiodinium microadriaticum TaxID=2951 RepID=A0A1Q9DM07_SYMMI|nr:hypothetical protein AK812_SmicGene21601 [Symbiodinium microadriaticum]